MQAENKIQTERLIETFMALTAIDSPSRNEMEMSVEVKRRLEALGGEVIEDQLGNLIGSFPGNNGADPVLLCAHLDTVSDGTRPIVPIRLDDRITSDGTTILGADDKAGVAIILEILQIFHDQPTLPHPPIDAVFTVQEEIGVIGGKALDQSKIRAKWGFVLDNGGAIGKITTSGPTSCVYTFRVIGKAAHAAVAPEAGINAICAAALGITKCPCGKIDPEVVSGIGVIHGGTARNIVPDIVEVHAMIRSKNLEKLESFSLKMERAFQEGCEAYQARLEIEKSDSYCGYELKESAIPYQRAKQAAEMLGFLFQTEASLGGTDCNAFHHAGIEACAISVGMEDEHMKTEYIRIQDMVDGARHVLTAICL